MSKYQDGNMRAKSQIGRLAILGAVFSLASCASGPKRTYDVVKESQWELGKAPILSEVITTPLESAESVASRAAMYTYATTRKQDKFESNEAFEARVKNTPPLKNAFIATPLRTHDCTSYDFATKTYNISCRGFQRTAALSSTSKVTGTITLANAYTSRDVEMTELSRTYLSMAVDAVGKIAMSSEEAKAIDSDLMVGVVFSVSGVDYEFSGCGKGELTYLDSKACKELGFKSGSVANTSDKVIIPKDLLEFVVFRKSNDKVLFHKTYGLMQK